MVGTGFQSDAAAMARAVSGFNDSAAETRTAMTALENELMDILRTYQGAQAQAFWQLHTRLQEDMRAAGRELDTMSQLIGDSANNYNTGDADAAGSITSLVGQTGDSSILSRLSGS